MKLLTPILHIVCLAIAMILTMMVIIAIDDSFGLHKFFGIIGLPDLIITGLIISGSISHLVTKYFISFEKSNYSKLEIHFFHTGILYLILIVLVYNILSTRMSGGLDEAYKLATIVILIIYITTNALTVLRTNQIKN
jgi:hypothetical protein